MNRPPPLMGRGPPALSMHFQDCGLEYGLTIVLVEHRLAEVRRLADRVMVMDEGRVVAEGTFETILDDYDLLHRYGLRRPTEDALDVLA